MNRSRAGESARYPYRTDRIFNVGNEWFIATREGKNLGPFASRVDSEGELVAYLRNLAINAGETIRGD